MIPTGCAEQIEDAYRRMALEVHYRPAAPSDGFGNITIPVDELDLDAEAAQYAHEWWAQEDTGSFTIGCADYPTRKAMIYALEAARLCCAGGNSPEFAERLLRLALQELE